MLFLLRKLRNQMIQNNKVRSYLLYAIGEIVLVVVGILIALQIDNWNEAQKLEQIELSLLSEVKSNLITTLESFKEDTIYNASTIKSYRKIIYYIDHDLPYSNELDTAFSMIPLFSSPFATTSAYKTLQTKGLDIIKNQQLKSEIQRIFDVELIRLLIDVDKVEWSMKDNIISPFFTKHVRYINKGSLNQARPIDFEDLKDNTEFYNILSKMIRQRSNSISFYKQTIIWIQELIEAIDVELKSRS